MKRFPILFIVLLVALTACTRASTKGPIITPLPFTPPSSPSPTLPATEIPLAPISVPPTPTLSQDTPIPTPVPTETSLAAPFVTFLFTGQISPLPCTASETVFADVLEYLQPATFTIGAYLPSPTDCVEENASWLKDAGLDGLKMMHPTECMESECDPQAFSAAVAAFSELNLVPIAITANDQGVTETIFVLDVDGFRYGFITVRGENDIRAEIGQARKMADVVIVLPAWGKGSDPFPDPTQLDLARSGAGDGADLIVGINPVIQAFGEMEGVPVFFGLGNFYGEAGAEGMMVRVYFWGTEFLGFELFPTFVDSEGVHLTDEAETAAILEGLQKINEGLP